MLGGHFGRVLEAGELALVAEPGRFVVRCYDHVFPVDPRSLSSVLAAAADRSQSDTLAYLASAFERLPNSLATDRAGAARRYREQAALFRSCAA